MKGLKKWLPFAAALAALLAEIFIPDGKNTAKVEYYMYFSEGKLSVNKPSVFLFISSDKQDAVAVGMA